MSQDNRIPYIARKNKCCPTETCAQHGNKTATSANWDFPKTEVQENYTMPKRKKEIVTRKALYQKLWMKEFYDDYKREMERKKDEPQEPVQTEYLNSYGQISIDEQEKEMKLKSLIDKYPLYDCGITYYNYGSKDPSFKKHRVISRPISEVLDRQFL